jgi:ketosteroid isomerase-like protein
MDREANKAVVRRYLEMWNTGQAEVADEVLAPDWRDHNHPEVKSPADVKAALLKTHAAFPDFHIQFDSMLGDGENVAVQATIRRTQAGQPVTSRVAWFIRLAGGRMAEMWTYQQTTR